MSRCWWKYADFTAHVSSARSLAELEDKGRGVRRSRRRCVEMNGGHYMIYLWEVRFSSSLLLSRTSSGFWESQALYSLMSSDFGRNYSAQTKPFFNSSMTQNPVLFSSVGAMFFNPGVVFSPINAMNLN